MAQKLVPTPAHQKMCKSQFLLNDKIRGAKNRKAQEINAINIENNSDNDKNNENNNKK